MEVRDAAASPPSVPSLGFLDQWEHKIDAKGRLFLPAEVRPAFVDGVVLAPGPDQVVEVWTEAAFAERQLRLRRRPTSNARQRRLLRLLNQAAHRTQPDAQGRIVIPARLRERCQLGREVVVAGADDRLEIWDRARHEAAFADYTDLFELDEPASDEEGLPW